MRIEDLGYRIEELGHDKNHSISSLGVIKSGTNRGLRLPEKEGKWIYMSSHDEHARQQERAINYEWASSLLKLGFRIGKRELDGVTSFYIFRSKKELNYE
jgi:hypothetical protein